MRKRLMIASLSSALSAAPAVAADAVFETHFAAVDGGAPCYSRTYDAEHLAKHPAQRVARIEVEMSRDNVSGKPNTPDAFELGVGFMLRDKPDWYTGLAICKSRDRDASCFIEGDGGRFEIKAAAPDQIRVETGDYGIAIEGKKDFMEISGKDGDDRAFILSRAPRAECDAATVDLDVGK